MCICMNRKMEKKKKADTAKGKECKKISKSVILCEKPINQVFG